MMVACHAKTLPPPSFGPALHEEGCSTQSHQLVSCSQVSIWSKGHLQGPGRGLEAPKRFYQLRNRGQTPRPNRNGRRTLLILLRAIADRKAVVVSGERSCKDTEVSRHCQANAPKRGEPPRSRHRAVDGGYRRGEQA
jgi:hypothetical protein